MGLNINDFKAIGSNTNHAPKQRFKRKNTVVKVKKQVGEKALSIVLESIKSLKKVTREYFVAYTGLASSTVDKCLLILESDGIIKRERGRKGSQKQTTIILIK